MDYPVQISSQLQLLLKSLRKSRQMTLAEVPLRAFLEEAIVPYESDEITRLILDTHDAAAFGRISHLCVGDLRN